MHYFPLITCRNPQENERPSFCNIVVSFQLPDFQILNWSHSDKTLYSEASQRLGGPIETGKELYTELQKRYRDHRTDDLENDDNVMEPEVTGSVQSLDNDAHVREDGVLGGTGNQQDIGDSTLESLPWIKQEVDEYNYVQGL